MEQKQSSLSIAATMIARQIRQLTPMGEETIDLFQQFAKKDDRTGGKRGKIV